MCGIAGFFTSQLYNDYETILDDMIQVQKHRGPDDQGISIYRSGDRVVGLGHKRLSILDLTASGHQPMESADGQLSIVFNGEIYNYKPLRKQLECEGYVFKSNTDTEVILNMYHRYGTGCLKHFNGMFAFVLYDRKADLLFGARDRMGIRPFYYYLRDNVFVFGSEIKAILKFPGITGSPDYGSLYGYVKNRFVNSPQTIFQNIFKLEPGNFLVYKASRLQIESYWDVEDFEKYPFGTFDELTGILSEKLQESVRLRMISDVPFGAFLSGGLDSSLIVAMMAQNSSSPIKTFSVGFKEEKYSELPYAKAVARQYKTDHHELVISHKDITDNLYTSVWHRDAPVSETADIPIYLLAREAKKSVSVILTGEGSDEIFAGYPKYAFDSFSETGVFKLLRKSRAASFMVNHLPYKYRKLKLAFNTLCIGDEEERYGNWFASSDKSTADRLFSDDFKRLYPAGHRESSTTIKGITALDRMLYFDLKHWLPDNLLERGDKMLMGASLEGRMPFLDYNVVEYAFKLADKLKIRGLSRKYILKRLAEKYLPHENIYRKKVGFYIPVADWFRGELRDMVGDHLMSRAFRDRGIFNCSEVEAIINSHVRGIRNYEKEIWMLLNLEIWFRTFIDGK